MKTKFEKNAMQPREVYPEKSVKMVGINLNEKVCSTYRKSLKHYIKHKSTLMRILRYEDSIPINLDNLTAIEIKSMDTSEAVQHAKM